MVKSKKTKKGDEEFYAPPHKPVSATNLAKGMGVKELDLLYLKLNEIVQLLWFPENMTEEAKLPKIIRALEFFEGLEPLDAAEGMLAAQMVGTHFAALECLKRAALTNQTFAGRDMALKHAQKLMSLYGQQLATLNKHRGKGQQKVTVEHVNVEAGGQAIVGNVEAGQVGKRRDASNAIEHGPEVPLPGVKSKPKPARRRAKWMVGTHQRNTGAMRESPRCGAKTRKGTPLPGPGGQWQETLPHAWWCEGVWHSCGEPKRVQARDVYAGVIEASKTHSGFPAGRKEAD